MTETGFRIIKADTMQKAIEMAKQELGISENMLEIKVVSKGKKGILFHNDPVIIQVRKKQNELDDLVKDVFKDKLPNQQKTVSENDGYVTITDGKIIVKNPDKGGKYPTLEVGENIELIVNGQKVDGKTVVVEEDLIQINCPVKEPELISNLEVSKDKMNAYFTVNRISGCNYGLCDCSPALSVMVTTQVKEKTSPPSLQKADIIELLKEKGINFGVQADAINKIINCSNETIEKVLLATGQQTTDSINAEIDYVFKNKLVTEEEYVNPYKGKMYLSVDTGEVLAVKKLAVPGKHGINIFGETILPKQPEDVPLVAGFGVKLIKNGTVAVSTIAGRPVLEGHRTKKLVVLPVFQIAGNVDISIGSINFNGDIEVFGDVLEGFRLVAGKNIFVHGNVIQAELNANGEIVVQKNIISSRVNAGLHSLVLKTLLPELKKLCQLIDNLLKAMVLLKIHPAFRVADLQSGEGRLVQLLIDNKFKKVPKLAESIIDAIYKNTGLKIEELITAAEQLKKLTGLNPLRIRTEDEVKEIQILSDIALRKIEESMEFETSSNVKAEYMQNSIVYCSGDVEVIGRGVISSEIYAGSNIKVTNQNSVVRGGKLFPGQKAIVNELGSHGDVLCIVRINEGGELEAQLVHSAVTIESSFGRYQFNQPAREVKVYISSSGTLEVEKLKIK
jgi:uncharacterized protein (DUF342 family)